MSFGPNPRELSMLREDAGTWIGAEFRCFFSCAEASGGAARFFLRVN